ncbi:uncharacterized protein [Clytia hemisphaerica]|uniref:SAP domain-containing protein n=1 Tax=Clytia hemisphaerica TaxID=252671 RepID=A0A7M5UYT8_9CNID
MPTKKSNANEHTDRDHSIADWGKSSITGLRNKLKELHLSHVGKKIELQTRLFEHFNPPTDTTNIQLSDVLEEFRSMRTELDTLKNNIHNNNNINKTTQNNLITSVESPTHVNFETGQSRDPITPNQNNPTLTQQKNRNKNSAILITNDEQDEPYIEEQQNVFGFDLQQSLSQQPTQGRKIPAASTISRRTSNTATIQRLGSLTIERLTTKMHHLMANTLAPSTNEQYKRCTTNYSNFCQHFHLQTFPLTEEVLMLYTTFLSEYSSYNNIKMHLSALKFHDIRYCYHTQLPPLPRLYLLIRSIKRTQGPQYKKPKRQPITVELLTQIYKYLLNSEYCTFDRQMLWTACTTAFFASYAHQNTSHHPRISLNQPLHYYTMTSP